MTEAIHLVDAFLWLGAAWIICICVGLVWEVLS